jgi:hypothetical protein
MQRHQVGPIFRNSNGRPWCTMSCNCAFERSMASIRMRRMKERGIEPSKKMIAEFAATLRKTCTSRGKTVSKSIKVLVSEATRDSHQHDDLQELVSVGGVRLILRLTFGICNPVGHFRSSEIEQHEPHDSEGGRVAKVIRRASHNERLQSYQTVYRATCRVRPANAINDAARSASTFDELDLAFGQRFFERGYTSVRCPGPVQSQRLKLGLRL